MSDISGMDAAISRNKAELQEAKAQVTADAQLTELGKTQRLAELREAAQTEHARLLEKRDAAVKEERERLYTAAFRRGIASIDSYRGAYAQAYKADPKELEALKGQAKRTGDVLLAKAVLHAAFDRGFDELLDDAPREVHALRDFEVVAGLRKTGHNSLDLTRRFGLSVARSRPE